MDGDAVHQESENKKALKLFGIESLIIVLLIVVGIVVLSFFNILPLGKLLSPFKFGNNLVNTPPPQVNPKSLDVSVSSTAAHYTATLQNKEQLIDLLKFWKLQTVPVTDSQGRTGYLNNVQVVLTDKEQPDTRIISASRKLFMGTGLKFTDDHTGVLSVYLSPEILNGTLNYGSFLQNETLRALYNYSHPASGKEETDLRDKNFLNAYESLVNARVVFFKVVKN